ncbi:helix-turn-helix domain-containing protein [Streptomyces lydicus]|uniref:helix-turn-helix domain-containing protein n=1 Tax=Streptomyces lydicus TaxID=47763 RepID=UPI003438B74F
MLPDSDLLCVVPRIPKGQHLSGDERVQWITKAKRAYDAGHPIRAIAEQAQRSYGFVQRALAESGTKLRERGSHGPRGADNHPRAAGGVEPSPSL